MTVRIEKPAVNVREKLAELDKPTGIAGEAMLRAETPQEQFNLIGAGRRNILINGGFFVSQRGDFSSNTSTVNGDYTVDRFKSFVRTVTATMRKDSNQTVGGDIKNVLNMTATSSASGRMGFRQYVEPTGNVTPVAGKQATVSAWIKSSHPDAGIYVYDYAAAAYVAASKYTGGGEWQKVTLTFTGNTGTVSNNALEINFTIQSNINGNVSLVSGDYIEVAHPQLELGKVATPFEHRSYGEELALCQRYYQQQQAEGGQVYTRYGIGMCNSATQVVVQLALPVTMRDDPSLVNVGTPSNYAIYHGGSSITDLTSISVNSAGTTPSMITIICNVASGLTAGSIGELLNSNQSSTTIGFNAEL